MLRFALVFVAVHWLFSCAADEQPVSENTAFVSGAIFAGPVVGECGACTGPGCDGASTWVRRFGSSDSDYATAIATDDDGHVYVLGTTLGAVSESAAATGNDFLAKYDSHGAKLWIQQFDAALSDSATEYYSYLAVHPTGGVVVGGEIRYGNDSGEDTVPGKLPDPYITLLKYDADGQRVWKNSLPIPLTPDNFFGQVRLGGVVASDAGDIFITGKTGATLGDDTLGAGNISDGFTAKFDGQGQLQWLHLLGAVGDNASAAGTEIAVDHAGDVYVAGTADVAVDTQQLTGAQDIFVAKWNGQGERQWVRLFGTNSSDSPLGIGLDDTSSVYVVGESALPNTTGGSTVITAQYDASGNRATMNEWQPDAALSSTYAAFDRSGGWYLLAQKTDSQSIDTSPLYLARLTSADVIGWTTSFGSDLYNYPAGVSTGSDGSVYATGFVSGAWSGVDALGASDVILVKYDAAASF